MIDDQHVERALSRAGERQRAAAPDAGATQRALQQLQARSGSEAVISGPRRRVWPIAAVVGAAAAVALAVTLAGNSGTDTIRTVPATDPSPPERTDELDVPDAAPDLSLGQPLVRRFDGLPLTDVAVSPDAARIAVSREGEICIVSTSPAVPADADRCSPFPSGVAPGSVTWSPDGTALVFHHDAFRFGQEPDLVELDLATGELTVLTDDGVPIDGDGGDTDVAPTFTPGGTLYFFRLDTSDGVQATLHRYDGDGVVTPVGAALAGVPPAAGRSVADGSIVVMLTGLDGNSQLISFDVDAGTSRSVPIEGQSRVVADVAPDRALLVALSPVVPGSFELGVADFGAGTIAPVDTAQLAASTRVVGAGLSPDGTRIVLILADQDDPDGHQLLVTDIAADGSVGPLTVVATGPEFAPNDGDLTIKPAGLGRLGEIAWTDETLVYSLGPDEIVTLPLL